MKRDPKKDDNYIARSEALGAPIRFICMKVPLSISHLYCNCLRFSLSDIVRYVTALRLVKHAIDVRFGRNRQENDEKSGVVLNRRGATYG